MPTITKNTGGSYKITVSTGYDKHGRQQRKYRTISSKELTGLTERQIEKEVQKKAVMFENEVLNGAYLDGEKTTFEEFINRWFFDYAEKQLAPSTLKSYKTRLEQRIIPTLGHLKLSKIQPHHLLEFYNNLSEQGIRLDTYYIPTEKTMTALQIISTIQVYKDTGITAKTTIRLRNGEKTKGVVAKKMGDYLGLKFATAFKPFGQGQLSSKTIKHHHDLISSVLSTAVEWGIIKDNPAERVKPPKVVKKKAIYYEEQDVVKMIVALENEPLKYKVCIHLAIDTGMRVGELTGLYWSDINFDNNTIAISRQKQYVHGTGIIVKEPKTESGVRFVTVSDMVVKLLKKYQIEQKENRLKMGNMWVNSEYVFIHEDGIPLHPHCPYKWFIEFLRRNNMPKISFHALRHTNASLLIAQGVDIVTLSGRLGHSDKNVTLNTYSHIISSKEKLAASKMNDFYEEYL